MTGRIWEYLRLEVSSLKFSQSKDGLIVFPLRIAEIRKICTTLVFEEVGGFISQFY